MMLTAKKRYVSGAIILMVGFILATVLAGAAHSRPAIRDAFKSQYPTSTTDDNVLSGTGSECQICHESSNGGNGWNAYGWRIRQGIQDGGLSSIDAILAAEAFDSDQDPTGSGNLTEIDAGTQPGWTTGTVNTIFFKNGTTLADQAPPTIAGGLDPSPTPVPIAGLQGRVALAIALCLVALALLRLGYEERRA